MHESNGVHTTSPESVATLLEFCHYDELKPSRSRENKARAERRVVRRSKDALPHCRGHHGGEMIFVEVTDVPLGDASAYALREAHSS